MLDYSLGLFALCYICIFLFQFLAGRFSAMQDTIKHHNANSIFNTEKNRTGIKWLGIPRLYWYNINGLDWHTKFIDLNTNSPKRKEQVLFWKIHIQQLYDAWHWWKMWKIVFYNLTDVFVILTIFFLVYWLWVLNINWQVIFIIISIFAFIHFWTIGFWWIWSFNKHYDKWLIKKK